VLKGKTILLDELVITEQIDALNSISKVDLETNPVKSSQEILRRVPGLIIGQHAGGGKAEQIFLRGFDIDHGTDISLSVDGLPVNMVSHAHGQGYSDLHFLIPETIEKIEFGEGPYEARQEHLASAGFVEIKTRDILDQNEVAVEFGDFSAISTTGLFNIVEGNHHKAYVASSLILSGGRYETPQNINRF